MTRQTDRLEDTEVVQFVFVAAMARHIEDYLAQRGWVVFQLPVEDYDDEKDLKTFCVAPSRELMKQVKRQG